MDPEEVQAATGGSFARRPGVPATGVSIDSRSLEAGDIFFAIAGPARDGHAFVAPALERGAAFAVIARSAAPRLGEGAFLVVDDPLAALTALGGAARRRTKAGIVAITGSVGKTTTKEALRIALSATPPPTPRLHPTTTTGGCRCRSPGCRARPPMGCSRSA